MQDLVIKTVFRPTVVQTRNLVEHIAATFGYSFHIGNESAEVELRNIWRSSKAQGKPTLALLARGDVAIPMMYYPLRKVVSVMHPTLAMVSRNLDNTTRAVNVIYDTPPSVVVVSLRWLYIMAKYSSYNDVGRGLELRSMLSREDSVEVWGRYFAWVCNEYDSAYVANELSLATRLSQTAKLEKLLLNVGLEQLIPALRQAIVGGNVLGTNLILDKLRDSASSPGIDASYVEEGAMHEYLFGGIETELFFREDGEVKIPEIDRGDRFFWSSLAGKRDTAIRDVMGRVADLRSICKRVERGR